MDYSWNIQRYLSILFMNNPHMRWIIHRIPKSIRTYVWNFRNCAMCCWSICCHVSAIVGSLRSDLGEGVVFFFGNLKDSKKWVYENTKIPRPSNLVRKYRRLFIRKYRRVFKNCFWFTGIYVCFKLSLWFSDFQNSPRFHHRKIFGNARRNQLFWTHQIWESKNETKT